MNIRSEHHVLKRMLVVLCLLASGLLSPVAPAQELVKPGTTVPAQTAAWQPPEIAALTSEWWSLLYGNNNLLDSERVQRFLQFTLEQSQSLGGEDLVTAQSSIVNLKSLFELLAVAQSSKQETSFKPVPSLETYALGDLLRLRARSRELAKQKAEINLQVEQTESQFNLLQDRRDNLSRQYDDTEPGSPVRILVGINRVSARVEYELAVKRADNLRQRLKLVEQQIESIDQQQKYSRDHLVHTDQPLNAVADAARAAKAQVVSMTEKVAALQPQLLQVLSATRANPSLEILRKQQMTRAVAESQLSELQEALARSRANWYFFRAGDLDSDFDYQASLSEARRLSEDALNQADLWTSVSRATLIAAAPDTDLNTVKNIELAQSTARETLELVDQIRSASDDLLLTQDILSVEIIASQSGLSKGWARLGLVSARIWGRAVRLAEFHLFDIGDTPVTPADITKMLLIMALALGISWLIRFLLRRGIGREKVTRQAAIYSVSRVLHYVIIMVGLFAAMGSIGIDFSSFALIAGALSVGIGFGLQAIVNNFVSGLILLFEGTMRVGDYIELDSGLRGTVREINTRATIVTTNDSIDVVVPNSELVTTKLTNWTLRESVGRMHIPFGVAYGSDKEEVKRVALEAAGDVEFALLHMPGREPQLRLCNFGDSALQFEMLLWVNRQGVRRPNRVKANYLWALETRLREAHIEIPFPQRDLHVRSDFRADRPDPEMEPDPQP